MAVVERGPAKAELVLSGDERATLERWARRPKSAQRLALRCRIVLAAADGEPRNEIAARLGCHTSTVGRWRGRFARRGLDGLHDEPRPGKPRSIGDADVVRVIVKTLEEQPRNPTHWSTRSMAQATGMWPESPIERSSARWPGLRASSTSSARTFCAIWELAVAPKRTVAVSGFASANA